MISTSSYNDFKSDKYSVYSISGNRGGDAGYNGKCYSALAPKIGFWREWEENIKNRSFEENTKFYIREYWDQVLSKLDPETVYRELDNSILLCYEPNTEFCHRHIVAAWFELLLEVNVSEVVADGYQIEEVSKPGYVKEYLEEIIRTSVNMRGFKSLRAWYLFEKSEKIEAMARELEEKKDECYDDYSDYKRTACFLRCEADMAEDEYYERMNQKKLIKK